MRRPLALLAVLLAGCGTRPPPARLVAVGPRTISDQTSYPLAVYGEGLAAGMRLRVGKQLLPLAVVDAGHAFARIAPQRGQGVQTRLVARLVDASGAKLPGEASLHVVHDAGFPDPIAMVASAGRLFVASPTTDTLFVVDPATRQVRAEAAGDGPRALAVHVDDSGRSWVVVAREFEKTLLLIAADDPARRRTVGAPALASGLAVHEGVALVAERAYDTIHAIDLENGRTLWRTPVAPNPRALAVTSAGLAVGSLQAGSVEILDLRTGKPKAEIAPGPGVAIVGGRTAAFREQVMGGTAPRALVFSPRLMRLFMTSIGPNVGPNAARMEVSMNGGVAVLDPATGKYERHLGFGAGVTEGMALDDDRGLLYVADGALGQVRVLATGDLARDDAGAQRALLREIPIPPPDGWPTARPTSDYSTHGRAGVEVHSGTWALALADGGSTLFALNRLTGTVTRLDVRDGAARPIDTIPLAPMLAQRERRIGQALYYADLGRTGITCDSCHPEGQTGGILFTKTRPMRIYRSTSILGARETPPYFTPASQRSLEETASFVGGRNRDHNPALTQAETRALAAYTDLLVTPPNPFVGADGAPPTRLALPDGATGDARHGLSLFFGRAGCAGCHPAPVFTTDQDPATRGTYDDVGTPLYFPLREREQDLGAGVYSPPSLLGLWDVFPLYNTGTAGLRADRDRAVVANRFPLRDIVTHPHGRVPPLPPSDRNDLLAYLLSL